MTDVQFMAMVTGYATYYGPMMETWRILFLALSITGGFMIGMALMFQRGLSAYL